jgi:hypothetical protein
MAELKMTELTRRRLLGGAAALAASAPLAELSPAYVSSAHAAAPPAGTQAPGWYRYKVGDFEITVVTDGVNRFKLPDNMVTNVPRADVNAALVALHMESDFFVTPYNPVVVNTGSKLVLIDTGLGEAGYKASKGSNGQLLRRRHRSQGDRCRHHLALPLGSREWSPARRRFAGLSPCRGPGAGGRAQVLDGRRRDEPRHQGTHGRAVPEQPAGLLRRGAEAAAHL